MSSPSCQLEQPSHFINLFQLQAKIKIPLFIQTYSRTLIFLKVLHSVGKNRRGKNIDFLLFLIFGYTYEGRSPPKKSSLWNTRIFEKSHHKYWFWGFIGAPDKLWLIRFMMNISRIKVFLILQFTGKILFTLIHLKIKTKMEFPEQNSVITRENKFVQADCNRRL